LYGFTMGAGLAPDARSLRYGGFIEDSRDGPPSWNPRGNRLAYGTSLSGQASRLYITWADAASSAVELGDGKDPAWHPRQDVLVFNGTDGGQNPGLFLMSVADAQRQRLTNNGNDQRPTWTPNGQYIVFMSKDRDGDNWEVYRLERSTLEVVRLTNHPAQDGLPAVSPDGKWVAFMSDRGNVWRLWYVSIDGGEAQLLSNVSGQPIAWLEHAIQWVP
jgi:Tol biopolymer transport system component